MYGRFNVRLMNVCVHITLVLSSTPALSEPSYHRSPRLASVNTETQPGSVPQRGFGSSIGTNIWLLTVLTVTECASVPVGKFSIHSFVSASMTPSTGDAVVAVELVKKSRAPR